MNPVVNALDMVDEVNLHLARADALAEAVLSMTEQVCLDNDGHVITLAWMLTEETKAAHKAINKWWNRSSHEPEAASQDTGDYRPKNRTDRFDCQDERPRA